MSCPGPWAQVLTVSFFWAPGFLKRRTFRSAQRARSKSTWFYPMTCPPAAQLLGHQWESSNGRYVFFFPRWNNRNRDQSKKGATLEDMWSNIWIRYHVFTCIRYRIIFVMKRAILACIYIIVRSRDFPVQCGNHGLHPVLCAKGGEWIGFF